MIRSSMKSGYSRFPIHEPGNPLAFIGTLLVKKVRLAIVHLMLSQSFRLAHQLRS
jgi:CBS domain containing-hemolysin-like protein